MRNNKFIDKLKKNSEGELCKMDSSASRLGPVAGTCDHNNEPWGNVKG